MLLPQALLQDQILACGFLDRLADAAPTEDGYSGQLVDLYPEDRHYQFYRGLLLWLEWLGTVQFHQATSSVQVLSHQAGYTLRLLSDLIDCGQPLVPNWRTEGVSLPGEQIHPFSKGVDLLQVLEQRRLELLPQAASVRDIRAAVGLLLRTDAQGDERYLLVYDPGARGWQLPGGRYERYDGNLRQTLLRELSEELHLPILEEPRDLLLEELGRPLVRARVSPTYGLLTQASFQLFRVHLYTQLDPLQKDLRWVTEQELLNKRTFDGQAIHAEPLLWYLRRAGLFPREQLAA